MWKELKSVLVGIIIMAAISLPVGGLFAAAAWFVGVSDPVIMLIAYATTILTAFVLHLWANKVCSNEKIYCPECARTSRCYECATRGGWISRAEQEELDRDEDKATRCITQMEASHE